MSDTSGTGMPCRCGSTAVWRLILADPRDADGLRLRPDLCYECHQKLPADDLSGWLLIGKLPEEATALTPEEWAQVGRDARHDAYLMPLDLGDGTPARACFPSVVAGQTQPPPTGADPRVNELLRAVCEYAYARAVEPGPAAG